MPSAGALLIAHRALFFTLSRRAAVPKGSAPVQSRLKGPSHDKFTTSLLHHFRRGYRAFGNLERFTIRGLCFRSVVVQFITFIAIKE